uniref:Mediator of RNA polymerase II transcription subunit 15 n=1 Tax=Magallana gigas TaxID=29159 RepID=A0A8W8KBL0_MAGGI
MAEQLMDWRAEPFRSKVVAEIEEVVRSSASPMTKSSIEMENDVFQKAKTQEVLLFPAMMPDITKKSDEEMDKQPHRPPVAEFPGLHTTPQF